MNQWITESTLQEGEQLQNEKVTKSIGPARVPVPVLEFERLSTMRINDSFVEPPSVSFLMRSKNASPITKTTTKRLSASNLTSKFKASPSPALATSDRISNKNLLQQKFEHSFPLELGHKPKTSYMNKRQKSGGFAVKKMSLQS